MSHIAQMASASENSLEHQLDIDEDLHFRTLMGRMNHMRTERKNCDLIIKVESKEIHVHRNVMMASSDYFDAMFSHDTLEKRSGVVEMKGLGFPIMKKCVTYIYTGKLAISYEECEPLLSAVSLTQLTTVCDKTDAFLQSRLNPNSFFNIKRIAVKFNLQELNKASDEFALENLNLIAKENEFDELELKYIHFLISGAQSYDADAKMAVILQWIKVDIESRREFLVELTSELELGKISWNCGKYITENEELCYGSPEFMKLLYLGKARTTGAIAIAPSVNPRYQQPNSIIVFDKTTKALQAFKTATKTWTKMHPLHESMVGNTKYTAIAVKEWLYVAMQDKNFYRINVMDKNALWVEMKSMLEAHGLYLRAVWLDDFIYVAGSGSIERYSMKKDLWEKIRDEGFCPNDCEIAACGRNIFVFGSDLPVKNVCKYSPNEETWSPVSEMIVARQTPAAIASHDKIYVAGGCGLSDVEVYDMENNVWEGLPSMLSEHDEFRLFYMDDKLFAVGHTSAPQLIEMYDFNTRKWKTVEQMKNMKIANQASVAIQI